MGTKPLTDLKSELKDIEEEQLAIIYDWVNNEEVIDIDFKLAKLDRLNELSRNEKYLKRLIDAQSV